MLATTELNPHGVSLTPHLESVWLTLGSADKEAMVEHKFRGSWKADRR